MEMYTDSIQELKKSVDTFESHPELKRVGTVLDSSDGVVQLTPPTIFSLEECLDFIENDELLEVTPQSLRLRKKELDPNKRKRANKV